jgi:cell division transport system permease protein
MAMLGLRSDLPIKRNSASSFVLWLVMVLVFMASLAVTVNSYINVLLADWDRSVSGTLTVQVPVTDAGGKTVDTTVAKVVDILKRHPAVESAEAVPRAKVLELLKPWLGEGEAVADLPLPALIDVEMKNQDADAIAAVTASVKTAAPEAVIDDHRVWLNRVMGLAKGFNAVALAIMVLVTGSLGLTIVFATRASLAEFAQVIEVLHVVGAKDAYVAGQFARRALVQAVLGGIAGLALYAPALALVAYLASRVDDEILPAATLPVLHWVTLLALPIAAGLLAMLTAHITVRRALSQKV